MRSGGLSSDHESRAEWAMRVASFGSAGPAAARREPLTQERIVDAALLLVAEEGFEALTMRRLATALGVSPGALYVHVRDKAALDQLLIGAICARVVLPEPDGETWRAQALDVCRQLRDQYVLHPGVARAAFVAAPTSLDSLRLYEGLLGVLLAGGIDPEGAAWVIDAVLVYIGGFALMSMRRSVLSGADGGPVDRDEFVARLQMLPEERFPNAAAHARALTSGTSDARFDFAVQQLLDVHASPDGGPRAD